MLPQEMNRPSHLLEKQVQPGDNQLLVEPHRDEGSGLFLYKTYHNYGGGIAFLVSHTCDCHGHMCEDCKKLNTSSFHDLEVPLNPTDWEILQDLFLEGLHWTEHQLYHWLVFWKKMAQRRETRFFLWNTYIPMSEYWFFSFLFRFIHSGNVWQKNIIYPSVNKKEITTECGYTMIRISLGIYKKGGHILGIRQLDHHTNKFIMYSYEPIKIDQFFIYQKTKEFQNKWHWKQIFQDTVVQEINEEVRFRPGMAGMEECQHSFALSLKLI